LLGVQEEWEDYQNEMQKDIGGIFKLFAVFHKELDRDYSDKKLQEFKTAVQQVTNGQ